ncbi:MAG: hypothetical protein HC915_09220 [Anaerolineae bacterium]|nr:hypothetical protein [Anaerolineae bacterium]
MTADADFCTATVSGELDAENYAEGVTVEVTTLDDAIDTPDRTCQLRHAADSEDPQLHPAR